MKDTSCSYTFFPLTFISSFSFLFSAIPSVIALQDGSRNSIKNGSHVGPMREGQDLQVVCEVYGARPAPVISWHRSGGVVRGEYIFFLRDFSLLGFLNLLTHLCCVVCVPRAEPKVTPKGTKRGGKFFRLLSCERSC